MKIIKYSLCAGFDAQGMPRLCPVTLPYCDANLAIAQAEAHQGTWHIEDAPSAEQHDPQADVDAMLIDHEYRLMLLEQAESEV